MLIDNSEEITLDLNSTTAENKASDPNLSSSSLEEMYKLHLKAKDHEVDIEHLIRHDEQVKNDGGIYLFGYGSLIWKVGWSYSHKCKGFIKGYKRRFWQQSRDHRGSFEFPGRVLTIMNDSDYREQVQKFGSETPLAKEESEFESEDTELYGMCYLISNEEAVEIFKDLDYREKGGYYRKFIPCHLIHDHQQEQQQKIEMKNVIVYVGSTNANDNTEFMGPTTSGLCDDGKIISEAIGPSGKNSEYLFQLVDKMREVFGENHVDHYLLELEKEVKSRLE